MATDRLTKIPNIPNVSEEDLSPLVAELLDICCLQQELILSQQEQIQILRDEIAILKNQKPKPKIKPSNLENRPDKKKKKQESEKRGAVLLGDGLYGDFLPDYRKRYQPGSNRKKG